MSSTPFSTGKMVSFKASEAEARPTSFPRCCLLTTKTNVQSYNLPTSYPRPSSADSSCRSSPPSASPWRRHSATSSTSSTSPPWSLPTPPRTHTPPSTRRDSLVGAACGDWRTNAGPQKAPRKPSYYDVKLGMVFHLPGTQAVKDSLLPQNLAPTNRPWDHPAVVIAKFLLNGEEYVQFRTCTTFHGQKVEVAKPKRQQGLFLLADNDEDVVVHGRTRLGEMARGSSRFSKRTYVNLSFESIYSVKYEHLELHNGKLPIQFDQEAIDMIWRCKPF
ncbi:hypothetical protein IQ06DRAFT_360183 [Phaeosphaeriaceae sp. SRC1lsM3a]|nr:hypothetical protein IQ06DRAFT_360183 [Stagonospora sp. SRC1lsM3a]